MKLTVTVITYNEAAHIAAALDSVAWADEIIVVDSGSTDGTAEIARAKATRVITREWSGYSAQKNFAADQASNDWVLSMDADERVTPALAAEIRALLGRGPDLKGYRIRRVSFYLGQWVRSTDWFPDFQLRLYDRRAGRWNGMKIHESFRLAEGPHGQLRGELEHYAYRDIAHALDLREMRGVDEEDARVGAAGGGPGRGMRGDLVRHDEAAVRDPAALAHVLLIVDHGLRP